MTYCFVCKSCGIRQEQRTREPAPCACGSEMSRDWKAEGVSPGNAARLRVERELYNGTRGAAELFLPTTKDFEGPSDPDGTKGLREWVDSHGPRDSNKHPVYPEGVKRRSF